MDFNCKRLPSCMKKYCDYCCMYKKELLRNNNFVKNIEIIPRVIFCKSLEKCETFIRSLEVRNLGTISRRLKFFVDPNSDVSFKIKGNTELVAGGSVTIEVYVEPTKKKDIHHHRYLYAFAEHPDIIFEVPIIVIKMPPEVFVPSILCLHKVPVNTATYYEFVIYNPFECELSFTTCSTYENITCSPSESGIPAKDFCKLLLTAKIPSQVSTVSLVVTVNGKCHRILVHMEPSDRIIHLSSPIIIFDDMYMGLKQQKSLFICNKSLEDVSFQWTTCTNPPPSDIPASSEILSLNDVLTIKNRRGCISSLNSTLSIITFCPPYSNFPEEEEPPFKLNITIYLCCPLLNLQFYQLQMMGTILGPDIDMTPRDTDFGNIYMGEVKCLRLEVTNKGPIEGDVYLKECTDEADIRCTIIPNSISLKPGKNGMFDLKFYRRSLGRFLTKLTFKIRCGNAIPILLRGNSMAAQVKIWPESFEFGEIPICVPQKRFSLLANPLPVSIVVEPSVVGEGTDDPLILCVDSSKLPLHARAAPYSLCNVERQPIQDEVDAEEMRPCYSDFELGKKSDLVEARKSNHSRLFEDKVLDDIPTMANELLKNIKLQSPQFQSEPGMKIIHAALDCILNRSDYFDELKEKQNFRNMSWESLPENPKEIAIENERFYMKPNESRSFPVILVPNLIGPNIRTIEFRACPMGMDHSDIKTAIDSSDMQNCLKLQYKCIVPDLAYESEITFPQPIYVDQQNCFQMHFKNNQNAVGFVYFKSLPDTNIGILSVAESYKKFFIQCGETVTVPASVTYRQSGMISLAGGFQMIGRSTGCPFIVTAEVLPPKVRITPEKLTQKQLILEFTRARFFFENISPTIAKFSVSLKNDKSQYLEPSGGHLAPGQKILISVFSRFSDPGIYKNVIQLYLTHAEKISIPLQFIVEGTPVLFEPNIKLGFDCGTIFRSERVREYPINITNAGQRSYRVLFIKQKPRGNIMPPLIFNVQPPGIAINPKGNVSIKILLDTSKEVKAEELYCVDVMGEDNTRCKFFSFSCKCDVIQSKVVWNKPEVRLESGNENSSDTAAIINLTPLQVSVSLAVVGFFSLIDKDTNEASKAVNFKLEGKAVKQFLFKLNAKEADAHGVCQCFEGIVKCKANGKQQKSLGLYVRIINPGIKICNPNVTFFTQNTEAYVHISLRNDGSLPAKFCWKNVSTQICRTVFDDSCDGLSARTISEIILGLPDELVPQIPYAINTSPEVCFSDAVYSEGDEDDDDKGMMPEVEPILRSSPFIYSSKQRSFNFDGSKKASSALRGEKPRSPKTLGMNSESKKDPKTPRKNLDDSKNCLEILKEAIEGPSKHKFVYKKHLQLPSSLPELSTEPLEIGVEQILDYLGLPYQKQKKDFTDFQATPKANAFQFNENGHGDGEKKACVEFQDKRDVILPNTIHKAYVFLPIVPKGWTLFGKFQLDVKGGESQILDLKVTSLKGRIQVSQTNIDLARQVWYRTCSYKTELKNPCPFTVKIRTVKGMDKGDMSNQLINGTVQIISQKSFILLPEEKTTLNCQVILGLCYNFCEDIGIEVNNSTTGVPIRFHGSGLMPMVLPNTLNNMTRKSLDTVTSYLTLRSVYENVSKSKQGCQNIKKDSNNGESNISKSLTVSEEEEFEVDNFGEPLTSRRPHDFIALHYSDEIGPRSLEIERLIETWKFIAELKECEHLKQLFYQYYYKCMYLEVGDFDPVINLKLTICRPVPWEISAYVMNMGDIVVNETKDFRIDLTFLGPGRVFLSARTRIVIPGLLAWFDDCYEVDHPNSFVFYLQSPDESKQKLYRNMSERDTDECSSQGDAKVAHAHSFDIDPVGVHKRKKQHSEAVKIKKHYNKISFPYKSVKNPLILAEICQVGDGDCHNSTFQLVILFTALGGCYEINQTIDDYLLIDVHLGPTLPIQLQGRVTNMRSTEL